MLGINFAFHVPMCSLCFPYRLATNHESKIRKYDLLAHADSFPDPANSFSFQLLSTTVARNDIPRPDGFRAFSSEGSVDYTRRKDKLLHPAAPEQSSRCLPPQSKDRGRMSRISRTHDARATERVDMPVNDAGTCIRERCRTLLRTTGWKQCPSPSSTRVPLGRNSSKIKYNTSMHKVFAVAAGLGSMSFPSDVRQPISPCVADC